MSNTTKSKLQRFLIAVIAFPFALANAAYAADYTVRQSPINNPLNKQDPVFFYGDRIEYNGQSITLGPKSVYVDGSLSNSDANYPYVFNSLKAVYKNRSKDAASYLNSETVKAAGTETEPIVVYFAPNVYWVDDPDDPKWHPASDLTGLKLETNWLTLRGLTKNAENVIICGNRGQTQGAYGNWTVLGVPGTGDSKPGSGFRTENLTIANYCNVDLKYALDPSKNREKRSETITQAQLVDSNENWDKVSAWNTRFISRLNATSFGGRQNQPTRAYFNGCYFECGDDAIHNGVYENCEFNFYSKTPFAGDLVGTVFLNCLFRIHGARDNYGYADDKMQAFCKVQGPGTIIDSRFITVDNNGIEALDNPNGIKIVWTRTPTLNYRNYQYNVTLNGKQIIMDEKRAYVSVRLENYPDLLAAFRVTHNGEVVYNTYNLLRGNDGWDPNGVKNRVLAASAVNKKPYYALPQRMTAFLSGEPELETGSGSVTVSYDISATDKNANGSNSAAIGNSGSVIWRAYLPNNAGKIIPTDLVVLKPDTFGKTVTVTGNNFGEQPKDVIIEAVSETGLRAAAVVKVTPSWLTSPEFISEPSFKEPQNGKLTIVYDLNLKDTDSGVLRPDRSLITWYRCTDAKGSNPIPTAVTRPVNSEDKPEREYQLNKGDIGFYILAKIQPAHQRSKPEESDPKTIIYSKKISDGDIINENMLKTDFKNFPQAAQPEIIPGFWTVDVYRPYDIGREPNPDQPALDAQGNPTQWQWTPGENSDFTDPWNYSTGQDGAPGYGLLTAQRGARLQYTAVGSCGDMELSLIVNPEKSDSQGFGSAQNQYLDIGIKYDPKTSSGYSFRIERFTSNADATSVFLVEHKNGKTRKLTDRIVTDAFQSDCNITLKIIENKFSASIKTTETQSQVKRDKGYENEANLFYTIPKEDMSDFGGILIQHTGTVSRGNRTQLKELEVKWDSASNSD
ncbi:MAG: hypothetical protein LBR74_02720 [Eubacterium sp.]|jgi:hypothetical protein|nr:hypothetical protein [Eubacterium sp.]